MEILAGVSSCSMAWMVKRSPGDPEVLGSKPCETDAKIFAFKSQSMDSGLFELTI
jgi:hypothetical protein